MKCVLIVVVRIDPLSAPSSQQRSNPYFFIVSSNIQYKWLSLSCFVLQFSSVSQSCLTMTPRTVACQASLSITNSCNLLRLMSIEKVMPSNHLICRPLLLPPSIFPSIRVFSNESVLHIRWPKYWSYSFTISSSMNIQD